VPAARFASSSVDSVVDLSALTLLPGLIDSHVHLTIGAGFRRNAMAYLQAGFTTVVDLGAVSHRLLRLRDSVRAGLIPGPRILAAGLWIGVKSGICEFTGIGVTGGPSEFRARVRENVNAGADVIKLCVSGWAADAFTQPSVFEMPEEDIAAATDEAHLLRRQVIAHDLSLGGVKAAIRSGVDGLAHAAYLDSAAALELAHRKVFLIPTLASLTAGDSSEGARALYASVGLAYRVRVPIVFGTDGGVLPHGRNAEEFGAMVKAGMSPIDAIRSATTNAAQAWRMSDSLGVIAPGMVADLIAVAGDPRQDVSALTRVSFVMARGKIIAAVPR
jgi:imidazolonepropionase-like amidohydrolase